MRVKQIMSQPVITVREEATLEEVAKIMLAHRIACVPVVNDAGVIVGVVTESDFTAKEKSFPFAGFSLPQLFGHFIDKGEVDSIYQAARNITAREIMTTQVISVTENELVRAVLEQMHKHQINHVPVVRNGVPVGIVARHDILKMMLEPEIKAAIDEG